MRFSTHRIIQIHNLNDRSTAERIAYYCRAIKATEIGNKGAARYFSEKARKWESIRISSLKKILKDQNK